MSARQFDICPDCCNSGRSPVYKEDVIVRYVLCDCQKTEERRRARRLERESSWKTFYPQRVRYCDVGFISLENEQGKAIPSIEAACESCGNTTESFGEGEASLLRCMALMRESCPAQGNYWYVPQ